MNSTRHPRFKIDGITDDQDTCDCCGRQGLKRTVRLLRLDADGNPVEALHYGTTCAAKALRRPAARIAAEAATAQHRADAAAEQRARFAATLERLDAALAGAATIGAAWMNLQVAAANGDTLAAAGARTGISLAANPFRRDDRHPLEQARAWYAEHAG